MAKKGIRTVISNKCGQWGCNTSHGTKSWGAEDPLEKRQGRFLKRGHTALVLQSNAVNTDGDGTEVWLQEQNIPGCGNMYLKARGQRVQGSANGLVKVLLLPLN